MNEYRNNLLWLNTPQLKKIFRALPVKLIDGLTVPVISAIELQTHRRKIQSNVSEIILRGYNNFLSTLKFGNFGSPVCVWLIDRQLQCRIKVSAAVLSGIIG